VKLLASLLAAAGTLVSIPALAQTPAPVSAVESSPEKLALARAVIDLAYPPAERHTLFAGAVNAMLAQMKQASAGVAVNAAVKTMLDAKLNSYTPRLVAIIDAHTPDLIEGFAKAYAAEFSVQELNDLKAFFAKPAGRHFMTRSTWLLSSPPISEANQRYMTDVMSLTKVMQGEMQAQLNDYFTKHPQDVPPANR